MYVLQQRKAAPRISKEAHPIENVIKTKENMTMKQPVKKGKVCFTLT